MKTSKIKSPRMVQSTMKVRNRDEDQEMPDKEINHAVSMKRAEEDMDQHPANLEKDNDQMKPANKEIMADHMEMLAEGGMVDEHEKDIIHAASIAAAIMAKKREHREQYAEGGEVDLSMNADEEPNHEDDMSFEALKKENYSESEGLKELGEQHSNQIGDSQEDEEENIHDRSITGQIRSKMRKKSPITK